MNWFNTLSQANQEMITTAMKDAAKFQRQSNRDKNAARLVLLKEKGMQVVENPDIGAFREKVAGLRNMELYGNPRVQDLLIKIIDAVK